MTIFELLSSQEIDVNRASRYANPMHWIQFSITIKFSLPDYKQNEDYRESSRVLFDAIQNSGSRTNAIEWAKHFMVKAIAYGIQTKNLDWRTKFIAAYEIYTSLSKGEY